MNHLQHLGTPCAASLLSDSQTADEDSAAEMKARGEESASEAPFTSLTQQYIKIFAVICAYWIVSISMVFLNSTLLSSKEYRIDAPLFVTFTQCVVTVAVCVILSTLSQLFPASFWFPRTTWDLSKLIRLAPVSVFFVLMITFNNICLKYVGVAFYTVSRSLTIVFNVIFSYVIIRQTTSVNAIICCAVIVTGFLLGIEQEESSGGLSIVGVASGILASASLSLYSIYTKKVLKLVNDSVSLLSFYNNVNASIMFVPLMWATGEFTIVANFRLLYDVYWWMLVIVVGVFGFAIGYVTMLQIQVTSPLTHNVSGTAKAGTQTVIAVMWFHQMKGVLWWISNALVLIGSALYTRVKQLEMSRNHQTAASSDRSPGGDRDDKRKLLTV